MTETLIREDLEYSGRKANVALGNFRLYGKSKHQQYFTPQALADTICRMLQPAIEDRERIEKLSVFDPTCGSGRLLLPWKKLGAQVLGVELDKETGTVAKRLIGKENVRTGDILDYAPHLRGFNLAVSNPPYGITWQTEGRDLHFETAHYGGSVESQAATIEIITGALGYHGILVTIIPASTFTNAKDKKLREHLYENYELLLRASLGAAFNREYGIDVEVDLIVARREYRQGQGKQNYEKVKLDVSKGKEWNNRLIDLMARIIEKEEISIYPTPAAHVPFLENIKAVNVDKQDTRSVNITHRGMAGEASAVALLGFLDRVVEDYNPVQGIQTGVVEAYLSPSTLIRRGIEPAYQMLGHLGFSPRVSEADSERIERLRGRFDYLSTPVYRPKPHQLPAYFYDKEYEAGTSVKDGNGNTLFVEGKKYHLHPAWVRNRETVKIVEAFDERKKKSYTIKTEVDRGYLAIGVDTESGERTFQETDTEEMKLFTAAFPLPNIRDVAARYPHVVKMNMERLEKEMPFLFDYQKEDVARLAMKPFGYLGYEMGGGKTVTSAAWAVIRGYRRILVVCQSGLVNNWLNELGKFGFHAHRMTTHRTVDGLLEQYKKGAKLNEPIFYITSYESLSLDTGRRYDPWDCIEYDKDGNIRRASRGNRSQRCPLCHKSYATVVKECPGCGEHKTWTGAVCNGCGYRAYTYTAERKTYPVYKRIKKLFDAVIVDEAQVAKSRNTMRGRAVRALKPKGKLILTGTLMKGYVHDLFWNVGWLLGHGNPLFPYNYRGGSKRFLEEFGTFEYVSRQFEDTLHEGRARLIPEVSNLNRFWRLMSSFTVRRLKDEMVSLPEKHKHVILLPMDDEHATVYNEFQGWASGVIRNAVNRAARNGGEVNMGAISSALWKLRFAATCPSAKAYLCKEPGPATFLDNGRWNKLEKVLELVKGIKHRGEKVIIFSGLRPMVSAIADALREERIDYVPVLASHKTDQRFEMIERFSNDGATAIVAGLNVLNRGFTITAANNVIITDIEFSPESVLQAEDRAHRTGQEKEVNIYYLFSSGTVDEDMFNLVSKKQEAISNAIDGKAVYGDVAELLESRSNIQLEVAKRVLESAPVPLERQKLIPQKEETMTTIHKVSGNDLYEELYRLKIEVKKKRRRKRVIDPNQMNLFMTG